MRKSRLWQLAALGVIATLSMGSGCPLTIPDIKDKVIELAVGGSTTAQFHAEGIINTFSEQDTADFSGDIDLTQILDDAGIDPADVDTITVAGVSYRVVVPDPTASRMIVNGNVSIARGLNPPNTPLITNFTETVNTVTSFKTAPLDPAGVALLNQVLANLLAHVKNGTPIVNPQIVYRLNGDSTPSSVNTDFVWEVKVDVSIKGKKAL